MERFGQAVALQLSFLGSQSVKRRGRVHPGGECDLIEKPILTLEWRSVCRPLLRDGVQVVVAEEIELIVGVEGVCVALVGPDDQETPVIRLAPLLRGEYARAETGKEWQLPLGWLVSAAFPWRLF